MKGNAKSTTGDELLHDHNHDGIDRRGFLKCMAWAGTGAFCVIKGGVLSSYSLSRLPDSRNMHAKGELSFVQISDSHMGFDKAANPDVVGTLEGRHRQNQCLARRRLLSFCTPATSAISPSRKSSTPWTRLLKAASTKDVFFVPGEHDVLNDDGKQYLDRYGKGTQGAGWYSFDKKGVHFIGLVNVMNLKAGGLGSLGGRATGVAGERCQASFQEHAHRRLRPHSALDRLSRMGLGHRRQRAGAFLPEALRLGHRPEWAHPPDHAEGGRQRHLPHRDLHCVSSTEAGRRCRRPAR